MTQHTPQLHHTHSNSEELGFQGDHIQDPLNQREKRLMFFVVHPRMYRIQFYIDIRRAIMLDGVGLRSAIYLSADYLFAEVACET